MDINLLVIRQINTNLSAIGDWHINGKPIKNLYSLEDNDKGLNDSMPLAKIQALKVYGKTAIPIPDVKPYEVVLAKSPRFTAKFGRDMYIPRIESVKGYDGILIHPANNAEELLGCLAPGKSTSKSAIGSSRVAYKELCTYLKDILGFTITMSGTMPILNPIKGFKQVDKVYLDIKRNYKL